VAQGLPWNAGDEVLLPLGEFPSNAWPWKALEARGVKVVEVPLWEGHCAGVKALESTAPSAADDPEGRILAAITDRTRLVAVSWVRFQDGLKLDLARLGAGCEALGVPLVVDGIQGAGTHVPDLRHVAAFASGGHKGLLTPQGIGFLWTSPAFRLALAPNGTWLSVEDGSNFRRPSTDLDRAWLLDGRRLEPGGYPALACAGFLESLRLLNTAGVTAISSHVRALQLALLDGLDVLPTWKDEALRLRGLLYADRLGAILSLHHQGRGAEFVGGLLQAGARQGIHASVREGYLRIALHGFHTEADVAKILGWLSETAN
jgi:selenocysteine lyase/cysteine desulfurase